MRCSTGRWVSGDDFFDRESELRVLEERVRSGSHLLLTGQRRMGKTSVLRELGRKLKTDGWVFLFINVEGATSEKDVVSDLAEAVLPVGGIWLRFAAPMERWFGERIEEVSAHSFRLKLRDGIGGSSWRRHGERLIRACAEHDRPVLLAMDELPIFLSRMLREKDGAQRVDDFLRWMRGTLQSVAGNSPILIVSGSIGLAPLVRRLGIPDRINHLHSIRLGPWTRETSIECLKHLAEDSGLDFEDGVECAVHEALGIGIPHYVQSYFARLKELATMRSCDRVTREDVAVVRRELLGPSGDNDLVHYRTRLEEGLGDDDSFTIALEILAEAATEGGFTPDAGQCLERLYAPMGDDLPGRIAEVLEVLVHDGYLEATELGYSFPFRLLRDWWSARYCHDHTPLRSRASGEDRGGLR